jgi:DNA-directed RNA polymerase specialized sigma24 family protein
MAGVRAMRDRLEDLGAQFLTQRHLLMAYIYGLIRDSNTAEDILQEIWLRLTKACREGVEIQDLAKWCRGTARNLVLHHWRGERSKSVIPDSTVLDLVDRAFDEREGSQGVWAARKKALSARILLTQVYESGHSLSHVAKQSGRTYAAVLLALSRSRKTLRDCIARKVQLEDRLA